MTRLRVFLSRLRGLFSRARLDADLLEDIETHLALLADEYRRKGLSDHEARLAARRAFGGVEQTRLAVHDVRAFVWVEEAAQDLRYALRLLARTPLFTVAAVLTLALGIGSATVIASVVQGLLVQPFPYQGAERLLNVSVQDTESGRELPVDWELFQDFRAQSTVFDGMVGTRLEPVTLGTPAGVELARGVRVTPDFFHVMGVAPQLGRVLTARDMAPESPRVAVLGHRTWLTRFNGDPRAVGQTIRVNGAPLTIVGVMPLRFTFQGADVWVSGPVTAGKYWLQCYARLKPGMTAQQADAQLTVIATRRARAHPDEYPTVVRATAEPFVGLLVDGFRSAVYTALGAVALLMLIACCNVANMLLARMTAREKEMTIRAALGAGRVRIVRQVLVEGLVLAMLGVAGGCLLAYGGIQALVPVLPEGALPSEVRFRIDGVVLATATLLGITSALLFGTGPALYSARRNLVEGLRGGGPATPGGRARLREALLVAEIALSLVLLASAGLLMRSFAALVRTDLGVDASRLLVMPVFAAPGAPDTPADQQRFYDEVLPRLASLPMVEGAAATGSLPPGPGFIEARIGLPGRAPSSASTSLVQSCTEGYFRAMGLRLLHGRLFSALERHSDAAVAVVNQAFVRRYLHDVDPLEQHIAVDLSRMIGGGATARVVEIIGVVEDVKNQGVRLPVAPLLYLPGAGEMLIVRTTGDPARVERAVDAEIRRAGRYADLRSVSTLAAAIELADYARPRFAMTALVLFATTGTVLVAMGIFGVFAYTVSRETRQIAIRIAVGATERAVVSAVLGGGVRVVLLGCALGIPATLAMGRVLESQLWSVGPHDAVALAAAVGVLTVTALGAAYIPARRAARVDPLMSLRQE